MRRTALLAAAVALAAGGAGRLALGPSGDGAPRAAASEPRAAALGPLPAMRPKVVQPVAGTTAPAAAEAPVRDPGLDDPGPAPSAPASAAGRGAAGAVTGRGSVTQASALPNGIAVPPLQAPEAVKQIIEAGNVIARSPYVWGGGHGRWIDKGYDCSGSVSFALAAAGLLDGPLDSGRLMSWGEAGPGRWVTIYANAGHVFMEVAGIRFDTSGRRVTGSRWQNEGRSVAGFVARHPPGL